MTERDRIIITMSPCELYLFREIGGVVTEAHRRERERERRERAEREARRVVVRGRGKEAA